ncbi:MAG: hypothetical protein HOO93_14945 [Methyloglobulus sp.]|nr:hypothetical protein [Methyloglobulus sp.]
MPLASCAPAFLLGIAKRDSCPFGNVRHPCRTPDGLIPIKTPVLGAAYGTNRCLRNMSYLLDVWSG